MKYVTVVGSDGKVAAVGKLVGYYGKWMRVQRNDNEQIAVNTDFVRSIHFVELPTQKMLESMTRSVPVSDEHDMSASPPIAVKQTSGRVGAPKVEEIVQNLVDEGPPGMREPSVGATIFELPRKVTLPKNVSQKDVDNILVAVPRRTRRKKSDS